MQLPADVWFARLAAETLRPFLVSREARSTMHNVVLNAILIRLVNFVGSEITASVTQSMELPLIYFETAEFYDLSVAVELGKL